MKGELPRLSDAEPEVIKSVIKLDSRSMVWAHDQAASDVEAMTPVMAVFLLVVLAITIGFIFSWNPILMLILVAGLVLVAWLLEKMQRQQIAELA